MIFTTKSMLVITTINAFVLSSARLYSDMIKLFIILLKKASLALPANWTQQNALSSIRSGRPWSVIFTAPVQRCVLVRFDDGVDPYSSTRRVTGSCRRTRRYSDSIAECRQELAGCHLW